MCTIGSFYEIDAHIRSMDDKRGEWGFYRYGFFLLFF